MFAGPNKKEERKNNENFIFARILLLERAYRRAFISTNNKPNNQGARRCGGTRVLDIRFSSLVIPWKKMLLHGLRQTCD